MNFFKALQLINRKQLLALPRLLSHREKLVLLFLAIILAGSLLRIGFRLSDTFSVAVPAAKGTLWEGVVGIPRFINPILAVSDVDRDLAALLYSGLMKYDGQGNIVPSLAERYEISEDGTVYTFFMRKDTKWSDGEKLAADDVVFTINLAKNPAYRSPARANWEGVDVQATDERTVQFKLQKSYAPFLENTVIGILPEHLWKDIRPEEFGLTELNLKPVGSGPYRAVSFQKNSTGRIISYKIERNKHFMPERAFIKDIVLSFYPSETELVQALAAGEIDSAGSVPARSAAGAEELGLQTLTFNIPRVFGIFYNQNSSKALADASVRKALELAVNKKLLVEQTLENQGAVIYSPIPPGSFGALGEERYQDRMYNLDEARRVLAEGEWADADGDGILEKSIDKNKKETITLSFTLSTSDSPSLVETAKLLQVMWKEIGVSAEVKVFEIADFEQSVLRPRKYDAVLFGEVVGHDPDPFAFWHSSQRNDPGLNIALYTNAKVDAILEKARTLTNPDERKAQYEEFQIEFKNDSPALMLYSPLYIYAVPKTLGGAEMSHITLPSDRFATVSAWYTETRKIWKVFSR